MPFGKIVLLRPLRDNENYSAYNAETIISLGSFLENHQDVLNNEPFLVVTSEHFLSNPGTTSGDAAPLVDRYYYINHEFIKYRNKLIELSQAYPQSCFIVNAYTSLPNLGILGNAKDEWDNTTDNTFLLLNMPRDGVTALQNPNGYVRRELNRYDTINNGNKENFRSNISMLISNGEVRYNLKATKFGPYQGHNHDQAGDILNIEGFNEQDGIPYTPIDYVNGFPKNLITINGYSFIHFICRDASMMWNLTLIKGQNYAQMPLIIQGDTYSPFALLNDLYSGAIKKSDTDAGYWKYPDNISLDYDKLPRPWTYLQQGLYDILTEVPYIIFADNHLFLNNNNEDARKVGSIYKWAQNNNRFERIDIQTRPGNNPNLPLREMASDIYATQGCCGATDKFYYSIYDVAGL